MSSAFHCRTAGLVQHPEHVTSKNTKSATGRTSWLPEYCIKRATDQLQLWAQVPYKILLDKWSGVYLGDVAGIALPARH